MADIKSDKHWFRTSDNSNPLQIKKSDLSRKVYVALFKKTVNICHVCEQELGDGTDRLQPTSAGKTCKICKRQVHTICGKFDNDDEYTIWITCKNCDMVQCT